MKKYLVSVPVMVRMEIYVDANNNEEAKEIAWGKANDTKYINMDTIEPIYFDDEQSEIIKELIDFAITKGYDVVDYEKEFGL